VFKDHFSDGSRSYAAHRPTYPIALVDALAGISPGRQHALDCGCGTGQLSVLLAEQFAEVVATDASAAQIENAQPHPRVTYRTALAEDSGLPDASVDLITVAQAVHWLDLETFYAEARRVARPDAAIALITYGVLHVDGAMEPHIQRFYYETIGPYWPVERRHVEDGYRSLTFPFEEVSLPLLAIEVWWTLDDLAGYINTWSAVRAAHEALGSNPVERLREDLRGGGGDPNARYRVVWPLSILAGRIQR
jgi:SAM-dependent methyltransferase